MKSLCKIRRKQSIVNQLKLFTKLDTFNMGTVLLWWANLVSHFKLLQGSYRGCLIIDKSIKSVPFRLAWYLQKTGQRCIVLEVLSRVKSSVWFKKSINETVGKEWLAQCCYKIKEKLVVPTLFEHLLYLADFSQLNGSQNLQSKMLCIAPKKLRSKLKL